MNSLICQAINGRRLVRFYYDGGLRNVEPHIHGQSSDGHELMRGYQVSGYSRSGQSFGWKTFRLDEISILILTSESFSGPRSDYESDDKVITDVCCRL